MVNNDPKGSGNSTEPPRENKSSKTRIGGTATPGARSTQPKQASTTNDPGQQQAEYSNRQMRRRMQRMQAGPAQAESPAEKRRKRIEKRKQKVEEQRAHLRRNVPKSRVALDRKTLYFIIGVAAFVILLIVIFVILRFVV